MHIGNSDHRTNLPIAELAAEQHSATSIRAAACADQHLTSSFQQTGSSQVSRAPAVHRVGFVATVPLARPVSVEGKRTSAFQTFQASAASVRHTVCNCKRATSDNYFCHCCCDSTFEAPQDYSDSYGCYMLLRPFLLLLLLLLLLSCSCSQHDDHCYHLAVYAATSCPCCDMHFCTVRFTDRHLRMV